MKCLKCKHELETEDRFCPQCGEKTIAIDDMDITEMFDRATEVWFSLVAKYGILYERKDLEELKKLEEYQEKDPELSRVYNRALEFAKKNVLTKLDEEKQQKASDKPNAH